MARLSEIPNCRYIKESTLEVTRVRDIIRLCGDRMQVFGGILGFESFLEGAVGWVAVAANVIPWSIGAAVRTWLADKHNSLDARALYLEYLPLIEFVGGQAYVAGTKALLANMGMPVGLPRPPRLPLSAEQNAAARQAGHAIQSSRLAVEIGVIGVERFELAGGLSAEPPGL